MSRHHYEDFWDGVRRRDPMVSVDSLLVGWRRPAFWHGRPRHRVVDDFTPRLSTTIRQNQARREKVAQGAAEMCVMAVAAMKRGGIFDIQATIK